MNADNNLSNSRIQAPVDIAAVASEASALRKLYRAFKNNRITGPVVNAAAGFILENVWAPKLHRSRVLNVLNSPDFNKIKQVPDAGKVVGDKLTMHNGLQIYANSYYNNNMRYVLSRTSGIHEPRQEYLFSLILEQLPPNSVMLELGSFWAFYSLWFHSVVDNANNILVEPDPERLLQGQKNFDLNKFDGQFLSGYAGGTEAIADDDIKVLTVPGIMRDANIDHVAIVHADIQGAELDLLNGATEQLHNGSIDYLFVSTHSENLHSQCREKLTGFNYRILEDIPVANSDSEDGLLVAQHNSLAELTIP